MEKRKVVVVPRPCVTEVNYWLKVWDDMKDYVVQEEAITELFQQKYRSNKDLKSIIIKCSVLNDFYSTNIFKVYPVAEHIFSLDIDESLSKQDIDLVNKIASLKIKDKEKTRERLKNFFNDHVNVHFGEDLKEEASKHKILKLIAIMQQRFLDSHTEF